jgi:hypothetical protein
MESVCFSLTLPSTCRNITITASLSSVDPTAISGTASPSKSPKLATLLWQVVGLQCAEMVEWGKKMSFKDPTDATQQNRFIFNSATALKLGSNKLFSQGVEQLHLT